MPPNTNPAWCVTQGPFIEGFAYGFNSPALAISVKGNSLTRELQRDLLTRMCAHWPALLTTAGDEPEPEGLDAWHESVEWLLSVIARLQRASCIPVFDTGMVLSLEPGTATCLVPTTLLSAPHLVPAIEHLLTWVAAAGDSTTASVTALQLAIAALTRGAPNGSNVYSFARAAEQLGMPSFELPSGLMQYGVGARARWLDSSYTDETALIGAKLARNKQWTSALLHQAGLPVPQQAQVATEAEALAVAQAMGYPVVVKPANLDGGVGVAAGLTSAQEVAHAYADACRHSNQILVEKHFDGRDYRLQVFQGALVWAVEREPAGVHGDGCLTVLELVALANTDPRRGAGVHAALKFLTIDAEALALLSKQGAAPGSVPAPGQFVRLRRIANVSAGGRPVPVFDKVHPDNAKLAVRAAQLLRLDLAGIDLLIPDIERSWLETGAAICEVNAQPQLGKATAMHLYPKILKKLVTGSGRIPTILMLNPSQEIIETTVCHLAEHGYCVGRADASGVFVAGEKIGAAKPRLLDASRVLIFDTRVTALVLAITELSLAHTGLPFKSYDTLVIAGPMPDNLPESCSKLVYTMLLAACDGEVVDAMGAASQFPELPDFTEANWVQCGLAEAELAQVVVRTLARATVLDSKI